MTRLPLLAAVAGLVAVTIAVLALSGGGDPAPTEAPSILPTSSATAPTTPSPSPSAATATATPGPRITVPPAVAFPSDLAGGWAGALRPVDGVRQGPTSQILFDQVSPDIASFDLDDFTGVASQMQARVIASSENEFFIEATLDTGRCAVGDVGHYRWSIDASWLSIELVEDVCVSRGLILPGSWYRSLADDGPGGVGLATLFRPFFSAELPVRDWIAVDGGGGEQIVADSADGADTFKVWKDPDGFRDPCRELVGRVDLAPGVDPFVAYLRQHPGFTVSETTETQIDGHRAVRITFTTSAARPCGTDPVLQWQSHAAMEGNWRLEPGLTDTVIVTEVEGTTLLFEAYVAGGPSQEIIESIRFLEDFPAAPGG